MSENEGLAFITILEGRNLSHTEPTDVYCVISFERQVVRTSTCRIPPGASAEWWSDRYTFDSTNYNSSFSVVVWGISKSFPGGKIIGEIKIPLSSLQEESGWNSVERLNLIDSNSQPTTAELQFSAHYSAKHVGKKVGFDDFTMLKFIGKGAYGKVMLVKKKDTNRLYTMKIMRKDKLKKEAVLMLPLIERDVLKKYTPYVVHLKFAFQTETHLYMVMDYLSGGDLFDLMEKRNTLDEGTTRFYAAQIVLAIGFLHDHDIIYRDLKPENLLIDITGNVCLVDFGLCEEGMLSDAVTHTFCGSLQYMAPEVLRGEGYGKSVDWWALGVIIYKMLTGLHPFMKSRNWCGSNTEMEIIHGVIHEPVHCSPRYNEDVLSKASINLCQNLLQEDPRLRLGAGERGFEEIKNHPFFSDIDWKKLAKKELLPPFKPQIVCAPKPQQQKMCRNSVEDAVSSSLHSVETGVDVEALTFTTRAWNEVSLENKKDSVFQNISYVASTEIARSRIKAPGFSGLSNISYNPEETPIDLAAIEAEEDKNEKFNSLRRQRRRWSSSNFHCDAQNSTHDESESPNESGDDAHVKEHTEDEKTKILKKGFLKSLFGKKQ